MKVGAENKKKLVAAIVLAAVAIFLLLRMFLSNGTEAASVAPLGATPNVAQNSAVPGKTATRKPTETGDRASRYIKAALQPSLDPRLRLDLLKESEGLQYEGTGRNIFSEQMQPIPKPVQGGLTGPQKIKSPVLLGPPPPPPINLKFYGWASVPGEAQAVFLAQGDDVFVAHQGDIIARRYKILRITPNSVEIQDVLSNNTQSIPLTQG